MDRGRGRGTRGGGNRGRTTGGRGGSSGNVGGREGRAPILDLSKYVDKDVRVKFTGGREIVGKLKGYDQLLNLVMDDVEEILRDLDTLLPMEPEKRRSLGLTVIRGTSLVVISPLDGYEEIANPFVQAE